MSQKTSRWMISGDSEQLQAKSKRKSLHLVGPLVGLFLLAAFFVGRSFFVDDPIVRPTIINGRTMGTSYRVKLEVPANLSFDELSIKAEIDERLDALNDSLSTYRKNSLISRWNRLPVGESLPLDEDFLTVFLAAKTVYEKSGGAFNPFVGTLVNLWGFGPSGRVESPPSDEAIKAEVKKIQFESAASLLESNRLQKEKDVKLDFSAIAKGYGVDLVAELLDKRSIDAYMVEIGGEVKTRGRNNQERQWRIGIEGPSFSASEEQTEKEVGTELVGVAEFTELSLASSGNYRNFWSYQGQSVGHTIDPRTGKPVTHSLEAVSVFHEDCMMADAWATALMVLGDKAADAVGTNQLDALLISWSADKSSFEQLSFGKAKQLVKEKL